MKTTNTFARIAAGLIVAAMMVTSCATVPSASSSGRALSPAQQQLRVQAKAYNRTVTEGLVGGAVAGAVLGALLAGKGNRKKGAAIGGLAGGLAGGLTGKYLASKQKKYANKEAQLDSVVADLHQQNAEAEALVLTLETVVNEHKATLASLNSKYEQGLISDADRRREMASIKSDRKQIEGALKTAKNDLKLYADTRKVFAKRNPDVDLSELDREITRQKELYDTMASVSNDLASVRGAA